MLGDRIDITLERNDVLSTQPLAFRTHKGGIVVLFRSGVAVLIGMSALEEDEVIRLLAGRITRPTVQRDEESTRIEIAPDKDEQILPGGAITLKNLTSMPDVLWERPGIERLYARLEDEYELKERADVLTRKLTVISDTAKALADIIDTERSLRLEAIVVILILVEICCTVYQIIWPGSAH